MVLTPTSLTTATKVGMGEGCLIENWTGARGVALHIHVCVGFTCWCQSA